MTTSRKSHAAQSLWLISERSLYRLPKRLKGGGVGRRGRIESQDQFPRRESVALWAE